MKYSSYEDLTEEQLSACYWDLNCLCDLFERLQKEFESNEGEYYRGMANAYKSVLRIIRSNIKDIVEQNGEEIPE